MKKNKKKILRTQFYFRNKLTLLRNINYKYYNIKDHRQTLDALLKQNKKEKENIFMITKTLWLCNTFRHFCIAFYLNKNQKLKKNCKLVSDPFLYFAVDFLYFKYSYTYYNYIIGIQPLFDDILAELLHRRFGFYIFFISIHVHIYDFFFFLTIIVRISHQDHTFYIQF